MAVKVFFRQNPTTSVWEYGSFDDEGNIILERVITEGRPAWRTSGGVSYFSLLHINDNGEFMTERAVSEIASDTEGTPYANRAALEKAIKGFFGNGVLEVLSITNNVSEAFVATSDSVVIQVETSDDSTISFLRSIDGIVFSTIPDVSMTVNDTIGEINLIDLKPGQSFKVSSTGTMILCKVLL